MIFEHEDDEVSIKLKPNGKLYIQVSDKNSDLIKRSQDNIKRIIIIGKMASGKDWFKQKLIEKLGLSPEISYTTRPIRKGEILGVTYNFISEEEFLSMIKEDKLYEHTKFVDWYYGTTHEEFSKKQIFIMNPEGLRNVKKEDLKDSFVFNFDLPENIRRKRLEERDMNYDSVERRIKADDLDFINIIKEDYKITKEITI